MSSDLTGTNTYHPRIAIFYIQFRLYECLLYLDSMAVWLNRLSQGVQRHYKIQVISGVCGCRLTTPLKAVPETLQNARSAFIHPENIDQLHTFSLV